MDLSFERSDWIPTVAAQTLIRNNRPLLAYIAGKPAAFTSKDHIFYPGETVRKAAHRDQQLARDGARRSCEWSFGLPDQQPARARSQSRQGSRIARRCNSSCPTNWLPADTN